MVNEMHPYATDSDERKIVPLYLAVLALVCAIGLSRLLDLIHWPGWIDTPATMGMYGLLYEAFRRWCWRIPILHTLRVVKVPILAGRWSGHVATSYDELNGQHPVEVEIVQDWTQMLVKLKAHHSASVSLVGSIFVGSEIVLTYDYRNEPTPGATNTMHTHRGSATLRLNRETGVLEGDYFSGRDRLNYGAISLTRQAS